MKSVFVISPYHYCHCVATLVEGLQKNGIKVFSNTNHNYVKNQVFNVETAIKVAEKTDVVVLAHSALEQKYKEVLSPLVNAVSVDVFLDGSDNHEYEAKPSDYKLYLKREFMGSTESNVHPFLFGIEDRYFAHTNKSHQEIWSNKIDDLVCIMSACDKRPWRFDIIESLKDTFDKDDTVFIGEYREGEALTSVDTGDRHFSGYFGKLLGSRISVDGYGAFAARQTGRFWESIANGCLVMYQTIKPYEWNNPFVDDEHFISYSDTDELIEKSCYYVGNPDKSEEIARKGYEHALNFHTTTHRANEFLLLCDRYL